jgi:hypothetical protein
MEGKAGLRIAYSNQQILNCNLSTHRDSYSEPSRPQASILPTRP